MDKCFCHFNGYEVKDAKARKLLEELKNITNANVNGCKVVKTLEEMTDTSILYILASTNHYFYYDEDKTSWVDGGLFGSVNGGLEDGSVTSSHLTEYLKQYINHGFVFELVENDDNSVKFKDTISGGVIKNNLDYTITGGLTNKETGETEPLYLTPGSTGIVPDGEYVLTFTSEKLSTMGVTSGLIKEMQMGISYQKDEGNGGDGIEIIENLPTFLSLRRDGFYLIKNEYDGVGSYGFITSKTLESGTIVYNAYVFTTDDNGANVPRITSYSATSNDDVTMMQEDNTIKLATAYENSFNMYENLVTGPLLSRFIGLPAEGNDGTSISVDNLKTTNKTLVGAINEVLSLLSDVDGGNGGLPTLTYADFKTTKEKGLYVINDNDEYLTHLGFGFYNGNAKASIYIKNGTFTMERISGTGTVYDTITPLNNSNLPNASGTGWVTAKTLTNYLGDKSTLQTSATNNIVSAINEIYSMVNGGSGTGSGSGGNVKEVVLCENVIDSLNATLTESMNNFDSLIVTVKNESGAIRRNIECINPKVENLAQEFNIDDIQLGSMTYTKYFLNYESATSLSIEKGAGLSITQTGNSVISATDSEVLYIEKVVGRKVV